MFLGNCKPFLGKANVFICINLVPRLSDRTWVSVSVHAEDTD